jgi:hypothetical protein
VIDPSNIVEIVTFPEDITRRLFYVWLAPSQYQTFTGVDPVKDRPKQPALKFIYRQIPADQIDHYTVNSVSNEKRGRSDLFPILGYLKRLRDAVNYELVAHQRQAAWNIDTTIEGSQDDVDAYIDAVQAMGPIPPAGSDFAHTAKIKRQFLSAAAGSAQSSEIFSWCLSMISAGVGIPVSYFGTHLSGSQARGAALVATEPVAKKFEMRQAVLERVVKKKWARLMRSAGFAEIPDCEVTFPEIITQDRSSKLKDLALAESQKWFTKQRCAEIAAKEMGAGDFEYTEEQQKMKTDPASAATGATVAAPSPLTAPGKAQTPPPAAGSETQAKPAGGLTGDQKKTIKDNYGA